MVAAPSNVTVSTTAGSNSYTISLVKPAGVKTINARWRKKTDNTGAWGAWSATVDKGNVTSWVDSSTAAANPNSILQWSVQAVGTDNSLSAWVDAPEVGVSPSAPTNGGTAQTVLGSITHKFATTTGSSQSLEIRVSDDSGSTWRTLVVAPESKSYTWTGIDSTKAYKFGVRSRTRGASGLGDAFLRYSAWVDTSTVYPAVFITAAVANRFNGATGKPDGDGKSISCAMAVDRPTAAGAPATTYQISVAEKTAPGAVLYSATSDAAVLGNDALSLDKAYLVTFKATGASTATWTVEVAPASRLLHVWAEKMRMGIGRLAGKDNTLQIALPTELAVAPTLPEHAVRKDYCDGPAWTLFVFDSYWLAGASGWAFPRWRQQGPRIEVMGGAISRQVSAFTLAAGSGTALFAGPGPSTTGARPIGPCVNNQNINGLLLVHYSSGIHMYNFSGASVTINVGTLLFLPSFITT